jgi:hypothetical protein
MQTRIFLYIYSEYVRKLVLSGCCFRFQKPTVSGGLQWVHHRCRSEQYQGPESYEAPQPVSEQQPHGQNPGANLWYMLSETCLSIHLPAVLVSTVASRAGLTALMSLNVSNSRVSNSGLHHLKPLQNLRSLTLESCRVTAPEIKKLQLDALPNLVSVRPE